MPGTLDTTDHITLGRASHLVPGRPSTNCMWRWCRKGVLARSGERIRLEHVRIGGRIFTRPSWVEEFGRRLTAADVSYFDAREEEAKALPPRDPQYNAPGRRRRVGRLANAPARDHRDRQEEIDRELDEEGL